MTVHAAHLTWPELAARIADGPPPLILTTGAFEQHGPHLALATDTLLPAVIAERVAERIGALVAPAIPYGYKSQPKSGGGNHFPGCASLDGATLVALVRDLIRDFARHGLTKIVLLDGHMENQWFLTEAADTALTMLKGEGVKGTRIMKLGHWEYISAETEAVLFPDGRPSWELEHAAVMETSVMMHLRPDLVRADLVPDDPPAAFPKYDLYPTDPDPIPPTGVLSPAGSASAEKGRVVIEQVVPDIAADIAAVFGR